MIKSKLRGHEIEISNGKWVYSDTKELTSETWRERACGECGEMQTKEDYDPCIGKLENVMNACCGHGVVDDAYIQYNDKTCIRGKEAIDEIKLLDLLK